MRTTHSQFYLGFMLILGFLFSSTAEASNEYPQLYENKVSSDNYEITKLIDGPIDSLYSINNTGEFIAQTNSRLWKINAQGQVIDYLDPDNFYASGLILEDEGFSDWVFTGDKKIKPYGETIDANAFSEKELFDAFDEAEAVEFSEDDETSKAFAYLYKQGQISILDVSAQLKKVDDFYSTQSARKDNNLRRRETDIKSSRFTGYHLKNTSFEVLAPAENSSSENIKMTGFKKITDHRDHSVTETFFENTLGVWLFGGSRRDYSFPVGYSKYELNYKNEILKFSIFSDKEYDSVQAWNFSLLEPKEKNSSDLKFITINYRRHYLSELNEKSLLPYYEQDVGLYVVRKKIPHNQSNLLQWRLGYSGLHSYGSISGRIQFSQKELPPVYYWFQQDRPIPAAADLDHYGRSTNIASPVLKSLPESLDFNWQDIKRDRNFRLVINHQDAEFYNHNHAQVAFRLYFDIKELEQAFKQLSGSNDTIVLDLDMQERIYGGQLIISLTNQKKKIILNNTSFDYQGIAYAPKSPRAIFGKMHTDLFLAYNDAFFMQKPDSFLNKVNQLKQTNTVPDYDNVIAYYVAQLSLNYNATGKFEENAKLFAQYFTIHHDLTRNPIGELQHKNLIVLAAQGLYLGSNIRNKDLTDKIVQLFVEKNFDLSKETNRVFLFNIACYYAINHKKPEMLRMINRTIELGKNPDDFLRDADFTDYREDPDFLAAIKQTP